MGSSRYTVLLSSFGPLGVVWQESTHGARVQRLFLPRPDRPTDRPIRDTFVEARPGSSPEIDELGHRISCFLAGQPVVFPLDGIALQRCPEFQQHVLLAEYAIPRGWVSTYGRIARHLGLPGGARAVGNALAHNPFPIIIPCHRAIRTDGKLGGFQGGITMKRALLELEGVEVSASGRVLTDRFYY